MGNEVSTGHGGGGSLGRSSANAGNSVPIHTPQQPKPQPQPQPTWTYHQSTGMLCTPKNVCTAGGYSGAGSGKNNSELQSVPFVGPIPQGEYTIGNSYPSAKVGPLAIKLEASGNQNMHGRDNFLIHGDSIRNPGSASQGCIVLPKAVREEIVKSEVKILIVKP